MYPKPKAEEVHSGEPKGKSSFFPMKLSLPNYVNPCVWFYFFLCCLIDWSSIVEIHASAHTRTTLKRGEKWAYMEVICILFGSNQTLDKESNPLQNPW